MKEITIINKLTVLGKSIPRNQLPEEMLDKTYLWEELSPQDKKWFAEVMQESMMGNHYKKRTA